MERFTQLFASLLVFVYHCFDRIVINGYLNGLSRPEQVVHFVREVLGIPVVSKEVLSQRTNDYRSIIRHTSTSTPKPPTTCRHLRPAAPQLPPGQRSR